MPGTVRILTWNVWWRFGPWQDRQPAIVRTIAEAAPDIVCLQEVWHDDPPAGEVNAVPLTGGQAGLFARALGFDHRFATAHREAGAGVLFGNALLSRWPLEHVVALTLPTDRDGPPRRSALGATVTRPGGPIPVICTHLDWEFTASTLRQRQVETIAACAAELGGERVTFPTVVCGDLNAVPDSEEIRALTGRRAPAAPGVVFTDAWEVAGDGPGWTVVAENPWAANNAWPRRRIDYVLVAWPRPAKPVGNVAAARLIGTEPVGGIVASDHYGVLVDLFTG